MVPFKLIVLAKFGLCLNCSQKLDECSLASARKNFATPSMLGFSLYSRMAKLRDLGKNTRAMDVSGNLLTFY